MAITYPINIIDELDGIGWSTDFNLMYRQEQSRHASGRTRVKDFGTPIWQATFSTKNLSPNQLDYWRARLNSLENGLNTFISYPRSRCWPINHPNGINMPVTTIQVNSKNVNNKSLSLKGALGLSLRVGDYISISNNLYQVMENAIANGSGITPEFEVRPSLSLSVAVNNTVVLNKPRCLMTLVPNSVSTSSGLNGRGSISFQGIESRG